MRMVKHALRWVLPVAVLGFVFVAALGAMFCQVTLHVPRKVRPAPRNAVTVSIFAKDHARLDAWWMQASAHSNRCVAVLHGIGDSRAGSAGLAPFLLDAGYNVLLPDSRAHGTSQGDFITYGLLEKDDVILWAQWMRRANCERLYALGESLGASILIESAAVQPAFAAIVAECPFADLRQTAEYRLTRMVGMPSQLSRAVVSSGTLYALVVDHLNLGTVSPVHAIARESTPILLIHGLADSRTPYSNSEQLERANTRNRLWLVPGAEHTGAYNAAPQEFERRVLDWFREH